MTSRDVVLPDEYGAFIQSLKDEVRAARSRAVRTVNTELIGLYWTLGRATLDRQEQQGWGAKVIDRLSADLRAEFPDMTGLGRANLHSMRAFAAAWPDAEVVQQAVGQLPWGHEGLSPAEQATLPSATDLTAVFEQPVTFHGRQLTLAKGIALLEAADDPRTGDDQGADAAP